MSEKIATLKLPPPLRVVSGTSVKEVIDQVQRHQAGCILVCEGRRLVGMMTERDVLMKVVARDVSSDEPVDRFMTPHPQTLTADHTVGEAISLMNQEYVPIVDKETGEAKALFRVQDVIDFLAESFPEQVINLPPRSDQQMRTPEGA